MAPTLTWPSLLFFALVSLWSLRLALFLALRIRRHHPNEDTRYQKLRSGYGPAYRMRFLLFYFLQGLSVSVLAAPFILVSFAQYQQISWLMMAGVVLFFLSLYGEFAADRQMSRFKAQPKNKGLVCDVGLWKYSRHPNYFFESCIWWSFYIFILGSSLSYWWAIYAPLIILYLLLKVTGVPPAEEQSLQSRGEAYREYQRRTSVFIPWFRSKQQDAL